LPESSLQARQAFESPILDLGYAVRRPPEESAMTLRHVLRGLVAPADRDSRALTLAGLCSLSGRGERFIRLVLRFRFKMLGTI
jgi:hypothetical protein